MVHLLSTILTKPFNYIGSFSFSCAIFCCFSFFFLRSFVELISFLINFLRQFLFLFLGCCCRFFFCGAFVFRSFVFFFRFDMWMLTIICGYVFILVMNWMRLFVRSFVYLIAHVYASCNLLISQKTHVTHKTFSVFPWFHSRWIAF